MNAQMQIIAKTPPEPSFNSVQKGQVQRKQHGENEQDEDCPKCRKGLLNLQRSSTNMSEPSSVPPIVHEVLNSAGEPLDPETRAFMEPRFGHDFGRVRVHADSKAVESSRALNALAYTVGQDIVFGQGQYTPHTKLGKQLLSHELTHVLQPKAKIEDLENIEDSSSSSEREAENVSKLVQDGHNAGPVIQPCAGIALTPISDSVKTLISYSATDWAVTSDEELQVISLLKADSDLSTTIADLESAGMLGALISRVDNDSNCHDLLQLLGSRLNKSSLALVEKYVSNLDKKWQLQFNLGRLGVTSAAPSFNPAPFSYLISSNPRAPFTGSGATGVNPSSLDISSIDQALLAAGHAATVAEYSNPIPGSLPAYLASLSSTDRAKQAELLLSQPISSTVADSYSGKIPSRAQVIATAAKTHKLKPHHLAAFLLAEQRDQSKNEDAKDYLGARSRLKTGNTSIGLGQVVVSTARNNDLFQDTLSATARSGLSHRDIAELLASDEFNIFAAARYIRKVADDGSKISIATLPNTKSEFPGINMAVYALDSSVWPDDNIRALASEYTSKPWDDNVSVGWADFVFEAYMDIVASGVSF